MKQSEIVELAANTMRAIIRMSRNPLVSRRGNLMVKDFLEKVAEKPAEKKPKEKLDS